MAGLATRDVEKLVVGTASVVEDIRATLLDPDDARSIINIRTASKKLEDFLRDERYDEIKSQIGGTKPGYELNMIISTLRQGFRMVNTQTIRKGMDNLAGEVEKLKRKSQL